MQWQDQFYLPGGGINSGEGTLAALHRECLEETGWCIRTERRLGAFQCYRYAADLDLWLRKVCHVYLAHPALLIGDPTERDHRAVWMPMEEAASHVAGVGARTFLRRLERSRPRRRSARQGACESAPVAVPITMRTSASAMRGPQQPPRSGQNFRWQ